MKTQLSSKTVWFNVIMLVIFVASLLDDKFLSAFGITGQSASQITTALGAITAVGNYVLRVFFTSQPIGNNNNQ